MSLNTIRKRIVIAEDDASVLELLTVRLELAGYHAVAARNGYQALERIRTTAPSGIVLDIGMPKLDGIGVLQELARCKSQIPVLVLTARRTQQEVQQVVGLGASCYLTKPFDDKHLLDRIARMIAPAAKVANVYLI